MNRQMRRKDRQLPDNEAYELLRNGEYGILSTVCTDGTPYGLPLSYALDKQSLYFHCTNQGGLKLENINHSDKACFTVVGQTQVLPEKFSTCYLSVIAFGTIHIVEDIAEKQHGLEALIRRYSENYLDKGLEYIQKAIHKVHILRFDIQSITGKGRR